MALQFNPFTGTFDVTTKGDTGAAGTVTSAGDGTAAAPGITFASDTNTGIYRPGADQLALSTGGQGRLFVDSSGNVAIIQSPITVPSYTKSFNVSGLNASIALRANSNGTYSDQGIFFAVDGTNYSQIYNDGIGQLIFRTGSALNERLRITSAGQLSHIGAGSSGSPAVSFSGSAPSNSLVVDSLGRVSIGTSTPGYLLDVRRSSAGDVVAFTGSTDGGRPLKFVSADNGIFLGAQWTRDIGSGSGIHAWAINGTERARIDSSGRLGIGTQSPGYLVTAATSADGVDGVSVESPSLNGIIRLRADGTNGNAIRVGGVGAQGNTLRFLVGSDAERMRIDSSGRLLVGTSSARSNFFPSAGWFPTVQIETATNGGRGLSIVNNRTDNNGPQITFGKANGSAIGSADIVLNNDTLGAISFTGADGTNLIQGARIEAAVDGTPGLNDMPGRLVFFTTADGAASPTERLRIDSSGRVGIGTASPDVKTTIVGTPLTKSWSADANDYLVIENSSTTAIDIRSGATAGGNIIFSDGDARQRGRIEYNHTNDELRFGTAGTNGRAILDSSGRLLVGSSSSIGGSTLQVAGTGGNQLEVSRFVTNSAGPFIGTFKSRGATVGVNTAVIQDDLLGAVQFHGAEGTGYQAAANIRAFVDPGTVSGTSMPGRLVFSTTADGAASPTERMRISANGDVLFSTDTIASITSATANANAWSETNAAKVSSRTVTTAANHYVFYNPNGNVGQIQTNGSSTSYNTSSDYRLKENVAPVTDGITRLQQLKPSRFNFIADPDKTVDGFIAHEVQTIVPEAITGEKDAVDDDGNPVYQGIDQSKIVPLLTAALQEAVAKIESLEARLTAAGI